MKPNFKQPPPTFENFFYLERDDDLDVSSDEDIDNPPADEDDCPRVVLTREEKIEIRSEFSSSSIIVKLFGQSTTTDLQQIWSQMVLECVDLGYHFFMITFHTPDDLARVFKDGPWFINGRFLSIRKWQPNFKPSKAMVTSSVAVWFRLPELPIEYYNMKMLKRIGNSIGQYVLRIDSERGKYVRLCVELDVGKPMPRYVCIGKLKQEIRYEGGICRVCLSCGAIGRIAADECPTLAAALINAYRTGMYWLLLWRFTIPSLWLTN